MYLDKINYNDILCKVDRATMYSSLESRAPFLSNEIVNFADKLGKNYLFKNGKGKYINREILSNFIPEKIFNVTKRGFGVPINQWLKGPLNDWANYLFNEHNFKEEYNINNDHVNRLWFNFIQNSHGNEKLIWNILILKDWDLSGMLGLNSSNFSFFFDLINLSIISLIIFISYKHKISNKYGAFVLLLFASTPLFGNNVIF